MSEETDPFGNRNGQNLYDEILNGERSDYDIIYRITARKDYKGNVTHVGIIECEGYKFAVDFEGTVVVDGRFFVTPDVDGCFPSMTDWMITNNSSIDYGIEVDTDGAET